MLAGGDDSDRRHFRAGARRGRHLDQRQAPATGLVDAVDVAEQLRALRVRQQRHQLGHVHGTAAAKADDQVGLHRPRL
ncbi:hypothetical protein D3C80_1545080 [compost metagenome]